MIPVTRLNHAVLYVSDVDRSVAFYTEAFGLEVVSREMGGQAAFLRSPRGDNHHDLGLFAAPGAPHPRTGTITGLYHLAWQVDRVDDLVTARQTLRRMGALTGQSDHGVSLSLYGADPDGNEFEIMWMLPRDEWGASAERAATGPLDLPGALARYGG
ncbi:MAG TPA: VOC family protein [Mycobacteriales bacterium]|nr:VOC family protein [Mycobacteriales bacterium]